MAMKRLQVREFGLDPFESLLIEYLISINYYGANTRHDVIKKVLDKVVQNPSLLDDGLYYLENREGFKNYCKSKLTRIRAEMENDVEDCFEDEEIA